eukprot:COSAG06_NODE_28545_length_572_cov_1.095137_1_plen_173_part_00
MSALLSGAAGAYICTLDEDADVQTAVAIHPEMHVHVSGDASLPSAPTWGTGSFSVADRATLSIIKLQLQGGIITVAAGGALNLMDLALQSEQLSWTDHAGSTLSLTRVALTGSSFVSGDPCHGGQVIRPASVDLPVIGGGVIDFFDGYPYSLDCSWTIQCAGVHLELTDFAT